MAISRVYPVKSRFGCKLARFFNIEILACEQALLFGRVKRVSQERASEGPAKGELATIPYKFSFVLRPDEGRYRWLKNDVPEIKVD